jgi:hypothetical protein
MLIQVFILSTLIGASIGFLVGGFLEWDASTETIRELKSDLRVAYKEIEELYEHIYSLRNPSVRR